MPLDTPRLNRIQLKNRVQSVLLLLAMGVFVGLLGLWLFGPFLALTGLVTIFLLGIINPAYSPRFIMKAYGASEIPHYQAQELHAINQLLAERASLPKPPSLYYMPLGTMNAFATGSQGTAAIGLSDGLLRQLNVEELAGVLAHEISHIKHNDMRVMSLADTLGQLTRSLSIVGQIFLLLIFPALLLGLAEINLLPFIVLISAPIISALVQLALSRNREFQADIAAALLLGEPGPLINALIKLDCQKGYWERFYRASTDNSILRTHPTTKERVEQLQSIVKPNQWERLIFEGTSHRDLLSRTQLRPTRMGRYYWF